MKLNRENKILAGLAAAALILIGRLFVIQILDDSYKIDASNNSMVYTTIYPTRGIIYDRNGKILVGNKVAYDILVTPKEVSEFDTLALSMALDVPVDFIKEKMDGYYRNRRRIGYQSVVMMKQLPPETYMKFAEISYMFPGFRGQPRSIRQYPYNAGGNLLGYVSEVDSRYIESHEGEYKAGDYAGMTGIEATCEKYLKGEKGYKIYLRDSRNRIESSYRDGEMDKEAIPGKDIVTTIDAELQLCALLDVVAAGGNVGCRLLEGRRLDVCQEAHPPHVYPDDGDVSRRGHACRAEECAVAAYAHGDGVGRRVVGRQECRVDGQPGLVVQEAGKVRLDGVCYPAPLE